MEFLVPVIGRNEHKLGSSGFHGLQLGVRQFSGATAVRVVHPAQQSVCEHRHDWPGITLHVLGGYTEHFDGGSARIDGPSAVLHPAGGFHASVIHECGLETVSLLFDPAWLRIADYMTPIDRGASWTGGKVATAARQLASSWTNKNLPEQELAKATSQFLALARSEPDQAPPQWINEVADALDVSSPPATWKVAEIFDVHPASLTRAYRRATGEGTQQTLRRRRVERAVTMLRGTDVPLAEVAVAAGFYDQSHMNRCLQLLLGRTPREVRSERRLLARFSTPPASSSGFGT